MIANELIKILEKYPDAEVFVNAWSNDEDYDHTSNIKVCKLLWKKNDVVTEIVICDENTEYWTVKIH